MRKISAVLRSSTYRLVGTQDRNVEVVGLGLGQSGQLDIELSKVGTGDLLIELLGKHVDTERESLRGGPQGNLGQDLVREGAGHDEGRVASGTSNGEH